MKHTATITSIGGTPVLTCEGLGIKNIEYSYKEVNEKNIIETITTYKHQIVDKDVELEVYDMRVEGEDYQTKKINESKEMKKGNNSMDCPKF